jgi:aminopeptidase N
VVATGSYDPQRRTYRVDLVQTVPVTPGQASKDPMVIPLALGLVGPDGRDLPLIERNGGALEDRVLRLTEPSQNFEFTDVGERPVLSLNRGFSAPIRLVVNLSGEDLRFLTTHDGDAFNRWQAFQTLATRLLVENAMSLRDGGTARNDPALTDALRAALGDDTLEAAFLALMLTVPGEQDIAREIGRDVDPAAVFAARSALRAFLGRDLGADLMQRYLSLTQSGPYRVDAASVGRRSLRNTCLDLLVATQEREAISAAVRQYHQADNMTDRMAALSALSLCEGPERAEALKSFYERYRGDPLILDKWFSLQAVIPEAGTLDRVKGLTAHPAFSFANPNRVRALIQAFALGNHKEFHRPDGAGYEFLVDTVLALDPKNPQLAARLLSAFKSWRVLEAHRRTRAQTALQRVAAAPNLSPDVCDIVGRTLAED